MLRASFYSVTGNHVRYGYNELMGHLGIPFQETEDFGKVQNRSSDILVIPEDSQINGIKNVKQILNRFNAIVMIGNAVDCFRQVESNPVPPPPCISGFLSFGKFEHVPLVYGFPIIRAKRDEKVLAKIRFHEGGISDGIIWSGKQGRVCVFVAPQIFKITCYLLSSVRSPSEEEFDDYKEGTQSELNPHCLGMPIVNIFERVFLQVLLQIAEKNGVSFVHKWFYPSAKKAAICLTHDVDSLYRYSTIFAKLAICNMRLGQYFEAASFALLSISSLFFKRVLLRPIPSFLAKALTVKSSKSYDFLDNILRFLKTEQEINATSSFFFLRNSSYKDSNYDFSDPRLKELVRLLDMNGCEIGIHGSYYSHYRKTLAAEKGLLENTLGHEIQGTRQHHLRLWVPESWRHQASVGLFYDTSLGYNYIPGFKAGCCLPFMTYDIKSETILPLLEIPLILQDLSLSRDRRKMDPKEATEICKRVSDVIFEVNGVFTLNWHVDYDSQTSPGWNESYQKILKNLSSHDDVWFTDGLGLAKWWISRSKTSFGNMRLQNSILSFDILSDTRMKDFTLRILPQGKKTIHNVTANAVRICEERMKNEGRFTFISVNLEPHINKIEVEMR